jgi:hypothetical protein
MKCHVCFSPLIKEANNFQKSQYVAVLRNSPLQCEVDVKTALRHPSVSRQYSGAARSSGRLPPTDAVTSDRAKKFSFLPYLAGVEVWKLQFGSEATTQGVLRLTCFQFWALSLTSTGCVVLPWYSHFCDSCLLVRPRVIKIA